MTEDALFGDIAVQEGFLTRPQLEECLRTQDGRPLPGELLSRGLLTPAQVETIREIERIHLAEVNTATESGGIIRQERFLLPCTGCETYYVIQDSPPGTRVVCRKCRRVLTVPDTIRRANPKPVPGTRSIGPYDTLSVIGRGSVGVIYKAVHRESGRVVALKVLKEYEVPQPHLLERFRHEAETVRRLSHPHLVAVHDSGDADGAAYIAMDYVEGTTLDHALAEGRMRLRDFVVVLEKVARAVHYAHQFGIVHRDLKPANILLDPAGEPRVTDFGLAKMDHAEKGITHGGASLGTPYYMSPEQVEGNVRGTDSRSDVYSLGILLYQALTGRVPYPGGSVMDVYRKVLEGSPERPFTLNPRVPQDLEAVCLKALQREKERRYPSAQDFADDLRRHLDGHPVRLGGPDGR